MAWLSQVALQGLWLYAVQGVDQLTGQLQDEAATGLAAVAVTFDLVNVCSSDSAVNRNMQQDGRS